jgi:hypothetical protein
MSAAPSALNIGSINIDGTPPNLFSKLKAFSLDRVQVPSMSVMMVLLVAVILIIVGSITVYNLQMKTAVPKNVRSAIEEQRQALQDMMSYYYKNRKPATSLLQSIPKSVGDPIVETENGLVNFMPLSVQDTGYLGPSVNGVFAEREAVQMALRAGARCFVLNIDYHDDQSLPVDLFGRPFEPKLLYRDLAGNVRSLNAGSIELVAKALADTAFSNAVGNPTDPLYVILFFRRTPPKDKPEYLTFLSQVAKELEAFIPYHLGQTPEGDYHRQGKQNDIMYQPISRFERKVLIFCNADTTPFRGKNYAPNRDLDYLVHVRMFKDTTEELGVTGTSEVNVAAKAIADTVASYVIVPVDKTKAIVDGTKLRWTMTLGQPGKNPSAETFGYLQDTLGVQCIPLWFYEGVKPSSASLEVYKAAGAVQNVQKAAVMINKPGEVTGENSELPRILARYVGYSLRPKPKGIRFARPTPFTPKAPSTKMDANQGKLTIPSM